TKGGITVTGGEALMQIDFLLELFTLAKQEKIHTCLDTSGITYHPGQSSYNGKLDRLMEVTDLVLLDLKHMDPEGHKDLTGHDNAGILAFAKYLEKKQVPVWIRHVVVPGITDDPAQLTKLGHFIGTLSNVKALDVLPYHIMGVAKYEQLRIPYPLEGVPPATVAQAKEAKKIILTAYWQVRKQMK
ncbi:MAG: radical SAM protein, partial [Clostridia bacterium]|nr:radical SAM protein [Clostridia bacterium]